MANSKVRCRGCDTYVPRGQARKLGNSGFVCGDLCVIRVREAARHRKIQNRINGKVTDVSAEVKKAVRKRDGGKCRWCGRPDINIHHIFYRSTHGHEPWIHQEWNLISLCATRCHAAAHSNLRENRPLLLAAQWMHYVEGKKAITIEAARRLLSARASNP